MTTKIVIIDRKSQEYALLVNGVEHTYGTYQQCESARTRLLMQALEAAATTDVKQAT